MTAPKQAGTSLTSPDASVEANRPVRRRGGLALVTYWVEAGVISTAAGAWASTALPGRWRIAGWVGVTTILAAAAIWFAEPVLGFLSRRYQAVQVRRPPDR